MTYMTAKKNLVRSLTKASLERMAHDQCGKPLDERRRLDDELRRLDKKIAKTERELARLMQLCEESGKTAEQARNAQRAASEEHERLAAALRQREDEDKLWERTDTATGLH